MAYCQCGCNYELTGKYKGARFLDDQHRARYHRQVYAAGQMALGLTEQEKKTAGMERAAGSNPVMLSMFQNAAVILGQHGSIVTIDDVRKNADASGIEYVPGAWMGSVFKRGFWECVGFVASTHEGSHGRIVRQWRLK